MKRKQKTIALKKQTISNLQVIVQQQLKGGTGPAPDQPASQRVCSPFCGPSTATFCDECNQPPVEY